MMTPMQKKKKKKKKNPEYFLFPLIQNLEHAHLSSYLWALSFCYHKMIFNITKSIFDITNLVCDTKKKKNDLMLGYNKIDFLI